MHADQQEEQRSQYRLTRRRSPLHRILSAFSILVEKPTRWWRCVLVSLLLPLKTGGDSIARSFASAAFSGSGFLEPPSDLSVDATVNRIERSLSRAKLH